MSSLWQDTVSREAWPALDRDLEVDVAVVGGGIAGVTAARLLGRAGLRVALVEARRLGDGDTGHTTAHLTELLDEGYATIRSHFGRDGAALAAESQRAAIRRIADLVLEDGIACQLARVPAYVYAETVDEAEELEEELAAMREAGVDATRVELASLPFPTRAALRVEGQGRFHPLAYVLGLARRFAEAGGLVFEGTRALEIEDGRRRAVVTPGGTIRCGDVVVTTHAPVSSRIALHSKMAPYRTYALAAEVPSPPADALYYDSRDPYHYVRLQEADGGKLLVAGGEDHKPGHEAPTSRQHDKLERWVHARWPRARVVARWSGIVWEPADGLAFIGRSSGSDHVWVGTGFSGTGMTFGTLAAMIVSDGVLGVESPYAKLYDATRVKPIAQARRYAAENADVAARLAKDRIDRGEVESLDEVPPGEGRLVRVQGRMVAAYRSEVGELSAVSARCTHLGCHVRWNDAEACWDCPCHGSRFSAMGAVLSGPAVEALAPVEGIGERSEPREGAEAPPGDEDRPAT
jgi:glycine/D-amino acid oxidase-like deaminating enzyme/nitrite reductase/ring-hydroxylating ferredoxin subunit